MKSYCFFKVQTYLEYKYRCLIEAAFIAGADVSIRVLIFKTRVSLMKVAKAVAIMKIQDRKYIGFHTLGGLKTD